MQTTASIMVQEELGTITAVIHAHAAERPAATALIQGDRSMTYTELDRLIDRVATALQREGVQQGDTIAICAKTSMAYGAVFLGALRAGAAIALLAPSSTATTVAALVADCDAKILFLDAEVSGLLASAVRQPPRSSSRSIAPRGLNRSTHGSRPHVAVPAVPKGIVHSHNMRWTQIRRTVLGLDIAAVSIVSTPLYSNTTLVPFFATLCHGGTVVLMERFDAAGFLQLAERHRATHAMLVPVQCQRIMALPDFDSYDLKSFVMKSSTVAPLSACLKADILKRWPGGLTEFYGMTEGGGACILAAHLHPTKLHTVGKPVPGSDIRLIDEEGKEVPQGESGEIVAHSAIIARLIAMQHSQCDEH